MPFVFPFCDDQLDGMSKCRNPWRSSGWWECYDL